MTGLLAELARDGYRIRLDEDKVLVKGPTGRMTPEALDQLRRHKPEIIAELRLQAFIDLVRMTGASEHGILLHRDDIAAQLDTDDAAELVKTNRRDRNAWASALAMRAVRYRGKLPVGWDKVAHCAQCGPVWSYATIECLACPWCELREAGKWFPVPDTKGD